MLAPGLPDRPRPPMDRGRVLLRRDVDDVGDRDFSADVWDDRLFQVTRAGEPSLDALVHVLVVAVLHGDRETGEVRGERTAGAYVPVMLAGIAVNYQPPHRRVAAIIERP